MTMNQQELMFNGRRLEDNRPLSEYRIQQASVVHMMIRNPNNIVVFVKTLTGKRIDLDLDICDTVKNLKHTFGAVSCHWRSPFFY
uniref:Ubiquitin-like domain-containing protein n=1 Tax=Sphaeramia orbicularis TaxID=375764 RepID=A0A673CY08_9TELE